MEQKMIQFKKLKIKESSSVEYIEYDPLNQMLKVKWFARDYYYVYLEVTLTHIKKIQEAESIGSFIAKNIKSHKFVRQGEFEKIEQKVQENRLLDYEQVKPYLLGGVN